MVELFDGAAWAILGGHIILAQGHKQHHTYHKWREKQFEWENINSPLSPNTLHRSRVEFLFDELPRMAHFIWMIAWVRESLIGNKTSHVFITPTLRRPLSNKEITTCTFHFLMMYTLLSYTWRESLEERSIAYHFSAMVGSIDEGRRRGREKFGSTLQLLEDKQHFEGG